MSTHQDPTIAKNEDAIIHLIEEIYELFVKVMKRAPRHPKPINNPCITCKGQGHMANKCLTPQNIRIKYTYMGGARGCTTISRMESRE